MMILIKYAHVWTSKAENIIDLVIGYDKITMDISITSVVVSQISNFIIKPWSHKTIKVIHSIYKTIGSWFPIGNF